MRVDHRSPDGAPAKSGCGGRARNGERPREPRLCPPSRPVSFSPPRHKREAGRTTITATRPSATIVKEQIIPPKEYLGIELRKGQRLRIIDVEGKQVPDMVCFNLKDPAEKLSCNNSRLIQKRWKLTTGNV